MEKKKEGNKIAKKEGRRKRKRKKKRKKGENDIKNHRRYSLNTSNSGKMQSRKTISKVNCIRFNGKNLILVGIPIQRIGEKRRVMTGGDVDVMHHKYAPQQICSTTNCP